jgi:hypothetical protein
VSAVRDVLARASAWAGVVMACAAFAVVGGIFALWVGSML